MPVITIEGVVENGQIRLRDGVRLPEHAKVFVIVPDATPVARAHFRSPKLADPSQSGEFVKEVVEGRS